MGVGTLMNLHSMSMAKLVIVPV